MKLPSNKRGFTLIELMVVISIIGTLSGMVSSTTNDVRKRARDARRLSDVTQVQKALEAYVSDNGTYPTTGGSWRSTCGGTYGNYEVTGSDAATVQIPGLAPEYIPEIPRDPKPGSGNSYCYLYRSNGTDYMFMAFRSVESSKNIGISNPKPRMRLPAEASFTVFSDRASQY